MDITRENFGATLDSLLERIASCDFAAVDLEMTGINDAAHPEDASMTLQQLYEAKRSVAGRFAIIQVGVSLFERKSSPRRAADQSGVDAALRSVLDVPAPSGSADEYEVRSYNVFVFPTADENARAAVAQADRAGGANGDVVLSPSAVDFLKQHGLDFQRWLYRGVPYVDKAGAAAVLAARDEESRDAVSSDHLDRLRSALTEAEEKWATASLATAKKVALDPDATTVHPPVPVGTELSLPQVRSANACACLAALVAADPAMASVDVVTRGRHDQKDASLRRRTPRDAAWAKRRAVTDKLGFWLVFEALAKSGKPCIAHNSFADWCFLHDALIGPLPPRVEDFAASLRAHVKGPIYDTKIMSSYLPTSVVPYGRFESTGLGQLYNHYGPSTGAAHLSFPEGFHAYHPEAMRTRRGGTAAHEAGYDAMMTGAVFANLVREFPEAKASAKDLVAVFGSTDCLDVGGAGTGTAAGVTRRVARGEVAMVSHPFRRNAAYSGVASALPCAHQFLFPLQRDGKALVALEPTPSHAFVHSDPLVKASIAALPASRLAKRSKPFYDLATLREATEAARSATKKTPAASLTVDPKAFVPEKCTVASGRGCCPHAANVPAMLRANVGAVVCSIVRRLRW